MLRRTVRFLFVPLLLATASCGSTSAGEKAGAPPPAQTPSPELGGFGDACQQHSDCRQGLACLLELCIDDYSSVRAE